MRYNKVTCDSENVGNSIISKNVVIAYRAKY